MLDKDTKVSKNDYFCAEIQSSSLIKNNSTMKKQVLIIMVLLVGYAMPAVAQKQVEARMQMARDRYATGLENIAINKQYEADEIPAVGYTTVVRKQNWAGSGQMIEKLEFYYNEIEEDMEKPLIELMNKYLEDVTYRFHKDIYGKTRFLYIIK